MRQKAPADLRLVAGVSDQLDECPLLGCDWNSVNVSYVVVSRQAALNRLSAEAAIKQMCERMAAYRDRALKRRLSRLSNKADAWQRTKNQLAASIRLNSSPILAWASEISRYLAGLSSPSSALHSSAIKLASSMMQPISVNSLRMSLSVSFAMQRHMLKFGTKSIRSF